MIAFAFATALVLSFVTPPISIETLPQVIKRVEPIYPDSARRAGIEGLVMIQALVGKEGRVIETRVARSIRGLDEAAVAAVRQWVFEPATVNGKPVAVWVAVPLRFPPAERRHEPTWRDPSEAAVILLPPSAIPSLPASIRDFLAVHGYRIPKADRGCNAFRAELERKGQFDWVVFCSTDSVSSLLVFWSGSPNRLEEVSRGPVPRTFRVDAGSCFYGRARARAIRQSLESMGGTGDDSTPSSASITHDGIEARRFTGRSEFLYHQRGGWIRLPVVN